MALLAAQRKLGCALDQDPWRHGIRQADPYVVLVSEQAHYCVERAVRILGWGPDAVVLVKTDDHHRMDVDDLTHQARELRGQGKQLLAVVGSACTTSAGAYDPLDRIAEWAHTEEVWFHVDGAHGAPAGFSNTHKHLVRGMSLADSVVLDFHKVCGLPALLTGVLYRDGQESFLPFVQEAEYLWERAEGQDWWDTGNAPLNAQAHAQHPTGHGHVRRRHGQVGASRGQTLVFGGGFRGEVTSTSCLGIGHDAPSQHRVLPTCGRLRRCRPRDQAEGAPLEGRGQLRRGHRLDGEAWLRCTFMNPLTELEDMQTMLDEFEGWMAEA